MHIIIVVTLFLYIFALIVGLISVVKKNLSSLLYRIVVLAILGHISSAAALAFSEGNALLGSRGDYIFFLSLAVSVMGGYFLKQRSAVITTGIVGVVTGLFVSSSVVSHFGQHTATPDGALLIFHVAPALIGEAALCLVAFLGGVFLWKERGIKVKSPSSITSDTPSLDRLISLIDQCSKIGFIALGFSVLTGVIWSYIEVKPLFTLELTKISAIVIWLILGGIILSKDFFLLSRSKVALVSLAGGALLLLSLLLGAIYRGNIMHG